MPSSFAAFALAAGFALQPTGSFHGNEVVARDGERWLGLSTRSDGTLVLVPTTVRLRPEMDPVLDGPGGMTGRRVEAAGIEEGRMLLRGPGLRAGPVETARPVDDSIDLAAGEFGRVTFRGLGYRLHAHCPSAAPPPGEGQACDVVLQQGLARQVLFRAIRVGGPQGVHAFGDMGVPRILHAADLDRDGRLDFIIDATDHYNAEHPTLFLSAPAGRGEMVRPVARLVITGC